MTKHVPWMSADNCLYLYPTLDTVWCDVGGRQWVVCPRAGCPRTQMRRLGGLRYQCRKCKTYYQIHP